MIRALLFLLLLTGTGAEAAGSRSVSHSEWRIDQQQVTVRIDFPVAMAAVLLGRRYDLLTTDNVGKYVLEEISVRAGGQDCPATDQGFDLGKVNALSLTGERYGFEIGFRCALAGTMTLRNTVFMEYRPGHIDYATVESGGQRVQQLFTAARSSVDIAPAAPVGASAARFVPLGARHMAGSLARIGALLALLLLAGAHRRSLLCALATGYGLSWLIAFSALQPRTAYLEAAVGFVCVAVVALLIQPVTPRRSHLLGAAVVAVLATGLAALRQPQAGVLLAGFSLLGGALLFAGRLDGRVSLVILAALFGIVDGFVLPGDFARLELERVNALPLLAFDLGSLLCAAMLLALGWVLSLMFTRSRLLPTRVAARDLAASLLSGFGLFWMLSPL